MRLYLERFLLTIFASLFVLVITGQTNPTFRVPAIATITVLALLAAVLAQILPSGDASQAAFSGRKRLLLVLLSMGVLLPAAYVLLQRPDMFQLIRNSPGKPDGKQDSPTVAPLTNLQPKSPDKVAPLSSSPKPPVSPEDVFIRKYVADDGKSGRTGAWTVVLSAAGPTGPTSFAELYAAAESVLSERGYAVRPLFRSTLLQNSAAYEELYTGNPALLKRIGIYRDGVLIGKIRAEVSQSASLDMFTAHLFADVRIISARPAKVEGQFAIDETGAGFSETAAASAAEHRLAAKFKQQLLESIPPK